MASDPILGPAWKERDVIRRISAIIEGVPAPSGMGTKSAAYSGFVGHSRDMVAVQGWARTVFAALRAPRPHPEFGDDGYREEMRKRALNALAKAEAWLARRGKADWSFDGSGRTEVDDE